MYVNRYGSMCHISPLFMYNCMGEFRKIICHRTVFAYTTENQLTYLFTCVDEDNTNRERLPYTSATCAAQCTLFQQIIQSQRKWIIRLSNSWPTSFDIKIM